MSYICRGYPSATCPRLIRHNLIYRSPAVVNTGSILTSPRSGDLRFALPFLFLEVRCCASPLCPPAPRQTTIDCARRSSHDSSTRIHTSAAAPDFCLRNLTLSPQRDSAVSATSPSPRQPAWVNRKYCLPSCFIARGLRTTTSALSDAFPSPQHG
jgi:hypothetical protein